MTKIAVYPGSFDPPHYGHIDVLTSALNIFDKVIILVSVNLGKKEFLSLSDRLELWKDIIQRYRIKNVEISSNETDLTAIWMRNRNLEYMVRGVRNSRDFDEEMVLHGVNSKLANINTIFIPSNVTNTSSSIIRELVKYGATGEQLYQYTSITIARKLMEKFYDK